MQTIYLQDTNNELVRLESYYCRDEINELQNLLEHNHSLLCGDQISPEDPLKWMLIKKELPVVNPTSGTEAWSLDFLFVDNNGILTFVECKRFKSTEARRKIVGQMLEYVANAQFYLTKDELIKYSKESNGEQFDEKFRLLEYFDDENAFFEKSISQLKHGIIRIIFFLDSAGNELKSIVNFLNRQMEKTEVLLIEALHYKMNDKTLIAPTLFGYSEEARAVKRTSEISYRNKPISEKFKEILDEVGNLGILNKSFNKTPINPRTYQAFYPLGEEFGLHYELLERSDEFLITIHIESDEFINRQSLLKSFSNDFVENFKGKIEYNPKWSRNRGELRISYAKENEPSVIVKEFEKLVLLTNKLLWENHKW